MMLTENAVAPSAEPALTIRGPDARGVRRLQASVFVPRPRQEVFAFFSDARNLDRITPPWLRFRILTPVTSPMREGLRIDYRLRIRGLPLGWTSRITRWEPPFAFTDRQERGPYRLWEHTHEFVSVAGGTECRDTVDFRSRGGWFEPWLHRLFVGPDLLAIFEFRRCELQRIFGQDARSTC